MKTRDDKNFVTFWFTACNTMPPLKLAISSMVQGAIILIAEKMRLQNRFEGDHCDMDLGVKIPLRRVEAFVSEMSKTGIPIALCGTVDCPTERAATRLKGMGFESELIE
jgi:hypothetical protein